VTHALLISALVASSKPKNLKFIHLIKKIKGIATSFHKLDFYHISKNLNQEADKETNIVAQLQKGELKINQEVPQWALIP
jgi:hypothetical protein